MNGCDLSTTTLPSPKSLLELAQLWYWELDADFRFTVLCPPAGDESQTADAIGHAHWEMPGLHALNTTWEAHREVLVSRQPFPELHVMLDRPGEAARYFVLSGEPMHAASGEFLGYRGTGRDVTDLWTARERHLHAEGLLAAAARLSRFGAWSIDIATQEMQWSEENGCAHDVPSWRTYRHTAALEIYTPESRARLLELYGRCAALGEPFDMEGEATLDGQPAWIRINGMPVRDRNGNIVRVQGAFQDITELKRSAERHRQSAQRLASIFASLTDGFGTIDRDWRVTFANPAAEQVLGKTSAQMLGQRIWDLFPGLDQSPFASFYRHAMERGTVEEKEDYYAPLGLWLRARAFPIEEGIAVCFTDVSEARRAQEMNRRLNAELERKVEQRTADLRRAYKDLESFSVMLAHDLRAPMRAVEGFATFVAQSPEQQLGPRSRDYLGRVIAAARRMERLTQAMLDLSRVSYAKLKPEGVDLSAMAAQVIRGLAEGSSRRVSVDIEPGLRASGDRALLEVLMHNLLGNAWKYTGGVGRALIEVGRCRTDTGECFFVRDNGAGFDSKEAASLFEPFVRLHGSEFEGTGIGLSCARKVVARHGGRIWAEAAVGLGATFYFSLGTAAASPPPDSSKP